MIKKALAFVACIFAAFSATAQSQTNTVTGESKEATSNRFHQNIAQFRAATPSANLNKNRIGVALYLSSKPGLTHSKAAPVAAGKPMTSTASGFQFIKAGAHDNDYTIAKRFDVSAKTIRILNPEIVWRKLHPGSKVRVPSRSSAVASSGKAAQGILTTAAMAKPLKRALAKAHEKPAAPKELQPTVYTVSGDDNDWIIARKFGMTPPAIRSANPDVDWSRLRPGRKIRIPGVTGQAVAKVLQKRKGITTHYAILRGDHINVRAGAKTSAGTVLKADAGTPVVVIDHMDNWYKLKFPHGTKGWVRGDLLEPQSSRPKAFLAYQRQNDEPVYASRSRDEDDNDDEDSSSSRSIRRRSHEFRVATRTHTTRRSYPAARRDRSSDTMAYSAEGGDGVISAARGMLGTRYRFGAESRSATDCSGLTQQVYRRQGVSLPRTAREQSQVGHAVSRGDLKPGDLVFFHTTRSGVSHVGIYKGNNEFIHASSGKGHVTISKLDGYYARRFVGARRVKGASKASSSGTPKKSQTEKKVKIKISVD